MTNPLALMMPVVPGTKMLDLVQGIGALRPTIGDAMTSIGTVHFARFLLLDRSKGNLQPDMTDINEPSDTLVISVVTEYDGAFNPYIADFAAQLGDVFDTLLAFVVGGADLVPVKDNLAKFQAFISENDAAQHVPNDTLYEAYPQTVQLIKAAFS